MTPNTALMLAIYAELHPDSTYSPHPAQLRLALVGGRGGKEGTAP